MTRDILVVQRELSRACLKAYELVRGFCYPELYPAIKSSRVSVDSTLQRVRLLQTELQLLEVLNARPLDISTQPDSGLPASAAEPASTSDGYNRGH